MAGGNRRAARCLLGLLLGWAGAPALGAELPLAAGGGAVGATSALVIGPGDTLPDIARRYDLGFTELVAANRGADPWLPPAGRRLMLPGFYLLPDAPRRGIVIDLAAERLFYYRPGARTVESFPIGVAVAGLATPVGLTRVAAKQKNPTWYPPASIRAREPGLPQAIPPGPDDPLGAFALVLGRPGYLIHGTNKPEGVGRRVSHGCIRLYPEDIARLFREVPVGTPVRVVDEPVKLRWVGNTLFLAVDPAPEQADALESGGAWLPDTPVDLAARVVAASGDRAGGFDWDAVARAGRERSGIPVAVASRPELDLSSNYTDLISK